MALFVIDRSISFDFYKCKPLFSMHANQEIVPLLFLAQAWRKEFRWSHTLKINFCIQDRHSETKSRSETLKRCRMTDKRPPGPNLLRRVAVTQFQLTSLLHRTEGTIKDPTKQRSLRNKSSQLSNSIQNLDLASKFDLIVRIAIDTFNV